MDNNSHISSLIHMGLSHNQAKIYLSLVPETYLTTDEIIERTNITRTKIYADLQLMEANNWIIREEGRPIKYYPVDPNIVFTKEVNDLNHQFNKTMDHLNNEWDERGKYQTRSINVISGKKFLRRETLKEIKNAQKEIIVVLSFVFSNELIEILDVLEIKSSHGLSIKLIIHPEVYGELDKKIKQEITRIRTVKIAPVPLRALVIDQENALLSFLTTNNEETYTESIRIGYSSFIEMMQRSINSTIEHFPDLEKESL